MTQYICHYIRNLRKEKPLTIADVEHIGSEHYTVRISWGGEYFDFTYDGYTFHPVGGKSNLLAGNPSRVSIKPYSCQDVLELMKCSDQLIAFSDKNDLLHVPSTCPNDEGGRSSILEQADPTLFTYIKIHRYTDYEKILADLAIQEYVSIRSSQNLIATIDKKFEISPKAAQLFPFLQEYSNHFYEADCLGTELHKDLTVHVQKLWHLARKLDSDNCQKVGF